MKECSGCTWLRGAICDNPHYCSNYEFWEAKDSDRVTNESGGMKDDRDKPRWSLLPWGVVEEVVKVLTHGAAKYSDDNWRKVETRRYWDALERHFTAVRKGEKIDSDSGLPHMAHAICCAMFIAAQMEGEK